MYIKQPKCPHCGRKFKDNRGLSAHIRFGHQSSAGVVKAKTPEPDAPRKTHTDLAIEETNAWIEYGNKQLKLLHDVMDGLLASRAVMEAIGSAAPNN